MISCNEELVMVPEFEPPTSERVVLIEELTGASCPACPAGGEELKSLKANYGDNIVIVGIHGFFQAWPTSESKYDFTHEDAAEIEEYLKPWQGKPAAAINRVQFSGEEYFSIDKDLWGLYLDKELEKEHVADVQLEVNYDTTSRNVQIKVGIIPLKDLEGELRFSLGVTEDHIIDAQKDGQELILDYEFEHVLRDMISDPFGDIIGSNLTKNQVVNLEFNYLLPTPEAGDNWWIPENCNIFGFLHFGETNNKEVLQAASTSLTE